MRTIITNRPDDKDGVITIYPETMDDMAQLEVFQNDGVLTSLKMVRHLSTNKQVIYFEIFYDRGSVRKAK